MSAEEQRQLFAGIEGGGTLSTAVLVDQHGQILSWVTGDATNYLLVGIDKCQETIYKMINEALEKANITPTNDYKLECLALGLSGCEDEVENKLFSNQLQSKFPKLTKQVFAVSDTIGPIFTACPDGGVVLISGTGSNCLLINPDSSEARCGGWGHLLGDEGAAYWIAHRAAKRCIDHVDNLKPSPHPIDRVLKSIYSYFKIDSLLGLLPHAYTNFRKPEFAGFCSELAKLADEGDAMAKSLFSDAGKYLASHIIAIAPKVDPVLMDSPGGLHVVCVGSVFKSWTHIRDGFVTKMAGKVKEMTLVRLKVSSALGCAYLAAKKVGLNPAITFDDNYEVFFHLKVD